MNDPLICLTARSGRRWLACFGIACLLNACGDDSGGSEHESMIDAAAAGHSAAGDAGSATAPTWHHDIAPIVIPKCSGCHQAGSIAPFSLSSYEQAKPWAAAMSAAVHSGLMPPFLAQETDECQPRFPWVYDVRLDDHEKAMMQRWADTGALEGKPANETPEAPPIPKLTREDDIMVLPEPIAIDGSKDLHTCVVVDPELTQDEYVVGRLITPGNPTILHHVLSYLISPGTNSDGSLQTKAELAAQIEALHGVGIGGRYPCFGGPALEGISTDVLDAWAPGTLLNTAPPDSGQPMLKDSLVLLDMHYHPTGEPQMDASTTLTLMFADSKPELVSSVILLGNFDKLLETDYGDGDLVKQSDEDVAEFMIPANAKHHVEEMTWTWKLPPGQALRVYAAGTHMHYVGRDMRVGLERASTSTGEPEEECLIQTPAWNFNWQHGYAYDTDYEHYSTMRNGDTLRLRCIYDNTLENPFVRAALDDQGLDQPVPIALGEDTLDEMCLVGIGVIAPNL